MEKEQTTVMLGAQKVLAQVRKAVVGKDEVLLWTMAAILAGGHILLEDIPGVKTGDRVVLMGTDGEETISAEALAAAAQSFNYEQICDISHRVTRVYYKDGQKCQSVNYLFED